MGSYEERAPDLLMERGWVVEVGVEAADPGFEVSTGALALLKSGVLLRADTGELMVLLLLLLPGEGRSEVLTSCWIV